MIKTRFGEANIQSCDVMLKDIVESKRVDRLIHMRSENVHHKFGNADIDCSSANSLSILLAAVTG
jgi:hypothetical protein